VPYLLPWPSGSARKLKLELLEHPSCSPDLAPLGVHVSGLFKDAWRGRHCASDQPVKEAVHAWLVSHIFYIIPTEYLSGFVQFSEGTSIIDLCNVNWFVFYNQDGACLLRGTTCINTIQVDFFCKGLILLAICFAFRPAVSIVRVDCELESRWKEIGLTYFRLLLLLLLGYLFYWKKSGSKTCWIWRKNFNNSSS
jgi:hypothetical protein